MPTPLSSLDLVAHQLDLRLRITGVMSKAVQKIRHDIEVALAMPLDTPPNELRQIFSYRVPKLGPGGACSVHHELDETPFDLQKSLGIEELALFDPEVCRVLRLDRIVELLYAATSSDWTGIYQLRDVDGEAALVKEAYRGRPSRAVFPCNPDFARTSNNATAVLTRRAILVRDVESHIAAGKPYYECDPEVRSELCLPVLRGREPVGLIDLESFEANHFDFVKIALAIAVASSLVDHALL